MTQIENSQKTFIADERSLSNFISDAVNKVFTKFLEALKLTPQKETKEDDLTDVKGISALTHYSGATIYAYVAQNIIPYYKINRRLLFSKSEILNWIKDNRSSTKEELASEAKKISINIKKK